MQHTNVDPDQQKTIAELEGLANSVAAAATELFSKSPTLDQILKLLQGTYAEVDAAILRKQEAEKPPLVCKKGCAWCCHEIVLATTPEILALFQYVQGNFSPEAKSALVERLSAYDAKMAGRRDRPFSLVREPCPFLVDNECTAYALRPLACRGRSSNDATVCRMWAEAPGDGGLVQFFIPQKLIARAAEKGLSHGSGSHSAGMHELGLCMNLLANDPSLANRILSGEESFPSAAPLAKPKVFPLDRNSISPPGVNHPRVSEAIRLMETGQPKAAEALIPPPSGPGAFIQMRGPIMYSSFDEILNTQQRMDSALDFLDQNPLNLQETLPFLVEHNLGSMPYQGLSLKDLLEKHGRIILEKFVAKLYPHLVAPIEQKRKPGRFRLGYISPSLGHNNGSRWAVGWLKNHSEDFETFAFNLGEEDIGSKMWAEYADHYYRLVGNVQRIAEFIREQDLDALIINEAGFRRYDYIYFSMRLARVQCTAWGTPHTSGLPNIDYYLSSDYMEPKDAQSEYTEKLIRLPRTGLCYPRPKSSFWVGDFTGKSKEFFPFMAQNIKKWTPQKDYLLKRIADRYGKPLKFVSAPDPVATTIFSQRLAKAKIPHELLPATLQVGYANYLRSCHVSFDPPDWSGGNTTIEALSYGVPVVTLSGALMRGRHSLAFLKVANAEALIANDEDEFVDLIFDQDRQNEVMKNVNVDALYDDLGVVHALDELLLSTLQA